MQPICISFDLCRSTKGSRNLRSGNEMVNANDAMHFKVKGDIVAHLRNMSRQKAEECIEELDMERPIFTRENPCHIFIYVCPPSKRRTDAPNWYPTIKPLIDGLTDANVLEDDNDEIITSLTFIPGVKTVNKKYQIIMELRPGLLVEM